MLISSEKSAKMGRRGTPYPHLQKMSQGVAPTSDILWTQANSKGNAMETECGLTV